MVLRLPRLAANQQLVDKNGFPTMAFTLWWASLATQIESSVNAIQAALDAAGIAQEAAETAIAAAATAQDAADSATSDGAAAQAAADAAAAQATANAREAAIVSSYITPDSVLTSSTTTIAVAAHDRVYGDGSSVSVTGGTVVATGPGPVTNYVSYSDPTRAGGPVVYVASTAPPTQGGDTHVVGAITVPAAGTATGGRGPLRPGAVEP